LPQAEDVFPAQFAFELPIAHRLADHLAGCGVFTGGHCASARQAARWSMRYSPFARRHGDLLEHILLLCSKNGSAPPMLQSSPFRWCEKWWHSKSRQAGGKEREAAVADSQQLPATGYKPPAALVTPITARNLTSASPQAVRSARLFLLSTLVFALLAWAPTALSAQKLKDADCLACHSDPTLTTEGANGATVSLYVDQASSSTNPRPHVRMRGLPQRRKEPGA